MFIGKSKGNIYQKRDSQVSLSDKDLPEVKELNEKGLDKMIHEEDDSNQFLPHEVAI